MRDDPAVGLAWRYSRRVNLLNDPPFGVVAILLPAVAAAVGASVAALAGWRRHMVALAVVFALMATLGGYVALRIVMARQADSPRAAAKIAAPRNPSRVSTARAGD